MAGLGQISTRLGHGQGFNEATETAIGRDLIATHSLQQTRGWDIGYRSLLSVGVAAALRSVDFSATAIDFMDRVFIPRVPP